MSTDIVILAAGLSSRMKSSIPKVMQLIAELPVLAYVVKAAMKSNHQQIILVTSPLMEDIRKYATSICPQIIHAVQEQPKGTGDAVKAALPYVRNNSKMTVIYGDTPFVSHETINEIVALDNDLILGVFNTQNPSNYGRVIKDKDQLLAIVEYNEASDEEKKLTCCNSGIISVKNIHLQRLIPQINDKNAKSEFYLTDLIKLAVDDGLKCNIHYIAEQEVMGINTQEELSSAQALMQQRIKSKLMQDGININNPDSSYIAYDFQAGKDVYLHPNLYIGPNVKLGDGVIIKSFSHIEGAIIADGAVIGPFARIRPETLIAENTKIGNFVEIKNSKIKTGAKINHLSYVGDAEIGSKSNIGAGTITCNYDGISKKSKTIIGDNVSIGSNSALIAPLNIASGAYIAAGSVVTKDVQTDDLVIARSKQINLKGRAKTLRKNHES